MKGQLSNVFEKEKLVQFVTRPGARATLPYPACGEASHLLGLQVCLNGHAVAFCL
jgi:hypothetical protein